MRAVWKFPIPLEVGDREFELPTIAKFLCFAILDCGPAAWFEVNPANPKSKRTFRIFGTGHAVQENYHHLGTALQPGPEMTYVWHLYEKRGELSGDDKQP